MIISWCCYVDLFTILDLNDILSVFQMLVFGSTKFILLRTHIEIDFILKMDGRAGGLNPIGRKTRTWLESGTTLPGNGTGTPTTKVEYF